MVGGGVIAGGLVSAAQKYPFVGQPSTYISPAPYLSKRLWVISTISFAVYSILINVFQFWTGLNLPLLKI